MHGHVRVEVVVGQNALKELMHERRKSTVESRFAQPTTNAGIPIASRKNCAEAWLDCQENIHPDERPDCPTMRHCLLGCVEDVECEADCRAAARQSTVVALNNLNGCSASNCVDEACRRETCPDELAACYPEAEIDRLTCAELVQCLEACEGPGACQENCRSEARPAARVNLQALDDCRVACGPDLAACRSLCPSEFARCDP